MLSILLIGLGLSMDACSLSVVNALSLRPFRPPHALWMGLYFGAFQALMPLLGALLAGTVSARLEALGPFLSFFLLAYIGGRMLLDALTGGAARAGMERLDHRRLLGMALATSVDALAAGVSLAFRPRGELLRSCGAIGLETCALCTAGALLAGHVPTKSGQGAGVLGGAVLLAMGLKLLLEGLTRG